MNWERKSKTIFDFNKGYQRITNLYEYANVESVNYSLPVPILFKSFHRLHLCRSIGIFV